MPNSRPNVPDWQHDANRKAIGELEKLGYRFKIGVQGYQVWFKDLYLGGGATVKFPHGRYHEANRRDYTQSALITAQRNQIQCQPTEPSNEPAATGNSSPPPAS